MDQIQNFRQREKETFPQYWERFKDLLLSIPHHNFALHQQINYFVLGCSQAACQLLDTMCVGDFMDKTPDDAWDYLEDLAKKAQT